MSKGFHFDLSKDGQSLRVGRHECSNGDDVRVLFAGDWYQGKLQLWRGTPCVWVDELGHVGFADTPKLPCMVQALEPLALKAPVGPAA